MKVVANSLPKSGTHLLVRFLELVGLQEHEKGLTGAMIRPTQRNPFRRYLTNRKRCTFSEDNSCFQIDLDDLENCIKERCLNDYIDQVSNNQFITAHVPYSKELDLFFKQKSIKFIYIIRDPRDVLLSYYNHQVRDKNYPFNTFFKNKTIEESYRHILNGLSKENVTLAPLKNRILNSQGWLKSENVLAVKFEELIGLKGGGAIDAQAKSIDRLLSFLEIELSIAQKRVVAEKIFHPKAETFYKGQIYRWRDEIGNNAQIEITNHLKDILDELGYE